MCIDLDLGIWLDPVPTAAWEENCGNFPSQMCFPFSPSEVNLCLLFGLLDESESYNYHTSAVFPSGVHSWRLPWRERRGAVGGFALSKVCSRYSWNTWQGSAPGIPGPVSDAHRKCPEQDPGSPPPRSCALNRAAQGFVQRTHWKGTSGKGRQ